MGLELQFMHKAASVRSNTMSCYMKGHLSFDEAFESSQPP